MTEQPEPPKPDNAPVPPFMPSTGGERIGGIDRPNNEILFALEILGVIAVLVVIAAIITFLITG